MPIVVDINLDHPVTIDWLRPRPRPPPLLQLSSSALRHSPEWQQLLDIWLSSPEGMAAMGPASPSSLAPLSSAMLTALQHLVSLAGGWTLRPPQHRLAFDSNDICKCRKRISMLHRLSSQILTATHSSSLSVGAWPRSWLDLISTLRSLGITFPTSRCSAPDLLHFVRTSLIQHRNTLTQLLLDQRRARHLRWKSALPALWQSNPGVL